MIIYSETIFAFISKCEKYLKKIISEETDIKLNRTRISLNGYTYPLHFCVFEEETRLAYFDPNSYQIGLNKQLIYNTKESVLKDILRHEFAHYICFVKYGSDILPHGDEYKAICKSYNWSDDIIKASGNLDKSNLVEGELVNDKLINKIKNLLKLAQSDNIHESQLATTKANQLLFKHNINLLEHEESKIFYSKKVYFQKRKNKKITAIYDIITHFFVRPILNYSKSGVTIEIFGSKTNIVLAEYIVSFLDQELERLWSIEKLTHNLKGLKAKNSFFSGLAKGYTQKMNNASQSIDSNALVKLNNQLDFEFKKAFKRLSYSSSKSNLDEQSFNLGKKAGKNLTINQAVNTKKSNKLLFWR